MENVVKKRNVDLHTISNTTLKTIRNPMRSKCNKQYRMNAESQHLEPKVNKRKYSSEFNDDQSKGIVPRYSTNNILEEEVLGESDDEAPLTNNISEDVILKMENVENVDLQIISNTTLKTNRKPVRSKHNEQYRMNAESHHLETKINKQNYSKKFNNEKSKEIVPSCSKNNILERAIAAMEKCTANLATPKVTSNEYEERENVFQFENISQFSNTSHKALIHSNVTYMANENEQYYKNETVSYLKKYTRRGQSVNSHRNEFEDLDDAEHLEANSFDAKHLVENPFEAKHYLSKNDAEKIKERSQAVVPFPEEKNNPWNNLMKKLHLDDDDDAGGYLKTISNYEKNKELTSRPPIHRNEKLDKNPKGRHERNFKNKINKQKETTDTENEQIFKFAENEETELLTNDVFKSWNVDNSYLNKQTRYGSSQKKMLKQDGAEKNMEKSERKMEKNERKASRLQTVEKSPKFKLQVIKDGNLKLKRHFSRSSSTSNSSEQLTVPKQSLKAQKINNSLQLRNNKAKEKYQKYLKKITIIAENDDDVFSLSSSDSEDSNQKNKGTGLLCELFEE